MSALTKAIAELEENESQWSAFTAPSPCVVLAPPGSGKTKLLTTRLASDLQKRIPEPHGAACITMTNSAADQLKDRLTQLGVPHRSNLFIGTVHSFALRCVVSPYARAAGLEHVADGTLADDTEKANVRAQAVEEIMGRYQDPDAPDLTGTLDKRRSLMDYDEATVELGGARMAQLARRYEELLIESGHYDFLDLIRFAVELIENHEWVLRTLAARFPNIYVDEYQDLPPGLDRLVQSLCFDERANAELFAVGDPDQAIFGYAGTAPHLIKDLADRPSVNDVWLDINYRNPQALIDAAIAHLGEERQIVGRADGGTIEAVRCDRGFGHQIEATIELVEQARENGTPLDEIVILARFNREIDHLVDAFAKTDIPIFTRRNRGYRPTQATDLVEAMAAWATQVRDGRGVVLRDIVRKLQSALHADYDLVRAAVDVMLEFRQKPTAPAREFLDAVSNAGFESRLQRRGREDELQEFVKQGRTFSEGGRLPDATVTDLGFRARARDRLLLSSIHGAKGLEFDIVILVDVDQGRIPFYRSSTPKEKAEDRRMFYVAITRARRTVYCLWTGWREFKGRRYEDGPSEYLVALKLV